MQKITKAVFPVAGLGTRFLPATKASPKEMLPIVDRPLIQYAVEEAVAAGITDLIFITGRGKRAIEDHFDKAYELEAELQAHGKNKLLKEVRGLLDAGITCTYTRQAEALGLGCGRGRIGQSPGVPSAAGPDRSDERSGCRKARSDASDGSAAASDQ